MNLPADYTLRAQYVFPVDGPPVRDGFVKVHDGRIVAVGELSPPPSAVAVRDTIDLGNVAILPGLVNAHVHLEFSDLTSPLGEPGTPLPDWIRLVLAYRRNAPAESHAQRVARGWSESVAAGTTTFGEIATQNWSDESAEPMRDSSESTTITAFYELIGRGEERVRTALEAGRRHLAAANPGMNWRAGLSPHAPYTISAGLLDAAVRLTLEHRSPLAIHLAESSEEIEWMKRGTGKFAELLAEHGGTMADRSDFRSPGDVIEHLRPAPRVLLIHGNYLDGPTLTSIAMEHDRFSIVYCPRTHAFFRHAPYPLTEMLRQGINVALGTDGRGSNPDLSILAEMRFVARQHLAVSPAEVLRLGTLGGATALGLAHEIGSLTPGKLANLAVVSLPDGQAAADPHELLFASDQPVSMTIVQGRIVSSLTTP